MLQQESPQIVYQQKLEETLQRFKQIAPIEGNNWKQQSNKNGYQIHTMEDKETGLLLTRGQGFIPYEREEIITILEKVESRMDYDELCESGKTIFKAISQSVQKHLMTKKFGMRLAHLLNCPLILLQKVLLDEKSSLQDGYQKRKKEALNAHLSPLSTLKEVCQSKQQTWQRQYKGKLLKKLKSYQINKKIRNDYSFYFQEYQIMIQIPLLENYNQQVEQSYIKLRQLVPIENNGWYLKQNKNGFKIYIKTDNETGFNLTRGEGFFPYTQEEIHEYLERVDLRPKYDKLCESGKTILKLGPKEQIFYQKFKQIMMVQGRDFVVYQKTIIDDNTWYAVGTSIDLPEYPPINGVVRANLKLGGWVLQKVEGGTYCIFITWANPSGYLPAFAVNVVSTEQGETVQKLRKLMDDDSKKKK